MAMFGRSASTLSAGMEFLGNDLEPEDDLVANMLQFGDHVSFYCSSELSSPGYISGSVTSSQNSGLVVNEAADRQQPNVGNFMTCVFQIRPAQKYKAQKKLTKKLKEIEDKKLSLKRRSRDAESKMMPQSPEEEKEEKKEIAHLRRLQLAEAEDNRHSYQRKLGELVHYGDTIQIYHTFTGKFVRVHPSKTAELEPNHLMIDMTKDTSKHTYFKIMPRFKVRTEGESIRMGDQIVLENLKAGGQNLVVSKAKFPTDSFAPDAHEVNLGTNPMALTIYPFRYTKDKQGSFLRGGDVIQLQHKEMNGWLSAEGPFPNGIDDAVRENVHIRMRDPVATYVDNPTTPITYWQIELEDPTRGDIVEWDTSICLKHVGTQMYLSITKDEISLVEQAEDDCSLTLHAVFTEKELIDQSYTRIESRFNNQWLHVPRGRPSLNRAKPNIIADNSNSCTKQLRELEWDTCEMYELSPHEQKTFVDAFVIHKVEDRYVNEVNYVAGVVPILAQYIRNRKEKALSSKILSLVECALNELRDFQYASDKSPIKSRQKLLRALGIVDLLIEMLKVPFVGHNKTLSAIELKDLKSPAHEGTRNVCNAIYGVLAGFLEGEATKNELYIARFIPFFQTQLGYGLEVEKMYTELVEDNYQIIDLIGDEEIGIFIEHLKIEKCAKHLEFLSALCECDDTPITAKQDRIVELLLESADVEKMLLKTWQDQGSQQIVVQIPGRREPVPLRALAGEKSDVGEEMYDFLSRQFDLIGKLCLGRNSRARAALFKSGIISQECILAGTKTAADVLPDDIRAEFVALCRTLFIDIDEEYDVLASIRVGFDQVSLQEDPLRRLQKTSVVQSVVAGNKLKEWIQQVLSSKDAMFRIGDHDHVEYLREVLLLLKDLVRFGYYAEYQSIQEMSGMLWRFLDGKTDQVSPKIEYSIPQFHSQDDFTRVGRYLDIQDNRLVADVRLIALEILELFLNYSTSTRLQRLLHDYNEAQNERGEGVLRQLLGEFEISNSITQSARKYLFSLERGSNLIWHSLGDRNKDINDKILLDLAKYDHSDLRREALTFLNRRYSSQEELFQLTKDSQLLSVSDSTKFCEYVYRSIPTLRMLHVGRIDNNHLRSVDAILRNIQQECLLSNSIENPVPHASNQKLVYKSGLVYYLLDAINNEDQNVNVVPAVLLTMRAIVVENSDAQMFLFQRLDTLLNNRLASTCNEMGLLMAAIFGKNTDLCLKVKARQIDKLVSLLASLSSSKRRIGRAGPRGVESAPGFLRALELIVRVPGIGAIKRNQSMVAKSLMKHSAVTKSLITLKSDKRQRLLDLLREIPEGQAQFRMRKMQQNYHLRLVSLLAACCENENQFIESMNQSFFDGNQLIEVIKNPEIPLKHREPYMRLLLWVYVKVSTQSPMSRKLIRGPQIWAAIKTLAQELFTASLSVAYGPVLSALLPLIEHAVEEVEESGLDSDGNHSHISSAIRELTALFVMFTNKIEPSLFSHEHIEVVLGCARRLRSVEKNHELDNIAQLLQNRLMEKERTVVPPIHLEYLKRFQDHDRINAKLQTFVNNLRIAYAGKNDIVQQLHPFYPGIKSAVQVWKDKLRIEVRNGECTESDFIEALEYAEDETEDEYLPRGPEFQTLVGIFRSTEANTVTDDIATLVNMIKAFDLGDVEIAAEDQAYSDRLCIRSLQIIRALIHNAIKMYNPDINQSVEQVRKLQEAMCEFDAPLAVLNVLHNTNDEVVREALACLVMLLKYRNRAAQQSIMDFFTSTREEKFFIDVRARMDRALIRIQEFRSLRKQALKNKQRAIKLRTHPAANETSAGRSRFATMSGGLRRFTGGISKLKNKVSRRTRPSQIEMNPLHDSSAPKKSAMEEKLDSQNVADEGNIELVLKVLQNLCEGHFSEMQGYLRYQEDNYRPIDLVSKTVQFLQPLAIDVQEHNIELTIQTIETLVEFCQGCRENQETVFKAQCIESLNLILRDNDFPGCEDEEGIEQVAEMKLACAKLILSLLEKSDAQTTARAQLLEEMLDIPAVFISMQEYYKQHVESEQDESLWLETAYEFFHVIIRLKDLTGRSYNHDPKFNPLLRHCHGHNVKLVDLPPIQPDELERIRNTLVVDGKEAHHHSTKIGQLGHDVHTKLHDGVERTLSHVGLHLPKHHYHLQAYERLAEKNLTIEVNMHGSIQKVDFRDKWSKKLANDTKENLKWQVDRETAIAKIRDFLERARVIMADIEYMDSIQEESGSVYLVIRHQTVLSKLLLLVTFVLNVLILATWEAPQSWSDPNPIFTVSWYTTVQRILGAVHLLLTILVCWAYYTKKVPMLSKTIASVIRPIYEVRYFVQDPPKGETKESLVEKRSQDLAGRIWTEDTESHRTRTSMFSFEALYYAALIIFSILALVYDGYFYCFHLLHIVVGNDILSRALQAVTKNGSSLLWVFMLMVIIIYIYSIISFAFLRKNFDEDEGQFCEDAWQCFISSLKFGLLSGGGLGEALAVQTFGFHEPGLRTLFDLSFFIIITLIAMNVVFGIIVDTFSELRDEKFQAKENMEGECFICSLPSHDFDRHPGKGSGGDDGGDDDDYGFDTHIHSEHNMWNYLFYMMHVQQKNPDEDTAHEQHVRENMFDTSWFPINRALALEHFRVEDEDSHWRTSITDQIQSLLGILAAQEEKQARYERAMKTQTRKNRAATLTRPQSNRSRTASLQRHNTDPNMRPRTSTARLDDADRPLQRLPSNEGRDLIVEQHNYGFGSSEELA